MTFAQGSPMTIIKQIFVLKGRSSREAENQGSRGGGGLGWQAITSGIPGGQDSHTAHALWFASFLFGTWSSV